MEQLSSHRIKNLSGHGLDLFLMVSAWYLAASALRRARTLTLVCWKLMEDGYSSGYLNDEDARAESTVSVSPTSLAESTFWFADPLGDATPPVQDVRRKRAKRRDTKKARQEQDAQDV